MILEIRGNTLLNVKVENDVFLVFLIKNNIQMHKGGIFSNLERQGRHFTSFEIFCFNF